MTVLRYLLAAVVLLGAESIALADEPIMTLNVAVKVSNLPGEVQRYVVNCVISNPAYGSFANGSATGNVVHSPTGNGTYVGSFDGRAQVLLYQSGPGQVRDPQNGYYCSLALVASNRVCSVSNDCQNTDGGPAAWSGHKGGTPFTPIITGLLPAPN